VAGQGHHRAGRNRFWEDGRLCPAHTARSPRESAEALRACSHPHARARFPGNAHFVPCDIYRNTLIRIRIPGSVHWVPVTDADADPDPALVVSSF
jgi:hypothetical protein